MRSGHFDAMAPHLPDLQQFIALSGLTQFIWALASFTAAVAGLFAAFHSRKAAQKAGQAVGVAQQLRIEVNHRLEELLVAKREEGRLAGVAEQQEQLLVAKREEGRMAGVVEQQGQLLEAKKEEGRLIGVVEQINKEKEVK